jgi:hypothetical protein
MMLQISNDKVSWYEVELPGDLIIPFVFAVDDLTEGAKRLSYSKQFTIYGTPRNVQVFAALYQTHAENINAWSLIKYNRPLYARLYGDAVLAYEGLLIVQGARYTAGTLEIDCVLYDNAQERLSLVLSEPLGMLPLNPVTFSQLQSWMGATGSEYNPPYALVPLDKGQVAAQEETNPDNNNNVREVGNIRTCYIRKTPVWVKVRAILSMILARAGLRFDAESQAFWGVQPATRIPFSNYYSPALDPFAGDVSVRNLAVTSGRVPLKQANPTAVAVQYNYVGANVTSFAKWYLYTTTELAIASGGSTTWQSIPGSPIKYRTAGDRIYLSSPCRVVVRVSGQAPSGYDVWSSVVRVNGVIAAMSVSGPNWIGEVTLNRADSITVQANAAVRDPNGPEPPPPMTVSIGIPAQLAQTPGDELDWASIMPDMTVGEFITMLMQTFNLVSYIYGDTWRFLPAVQFWSGETVDLSDRLDYTRDIYISLPATQMPRYWIRKFAHLDGYYYNRYKAERAKELGAIRYDSQLFYNRDTNEYECPLSVAYPTLHPVFRFAAGLGAVQCPRLTDGSRFSGIDPDKGLIGYIVPKPATEPADVFTMNWGAGYPTYNCNWRVHYQDSVGGQSFCLLYSLPEISYTQNPQPGYLPTNWQRFHEPYISEATAQEAKLVTCYLRFDPYEITSGSTLLWRPIQIDGVVYRFHQVGDIDILRGGLYSVQLFRRRAGSAPPSGQVDITPVEYPDKPTDIPTHNQRYYGVGSNLSVIPPGLARVDYDWGYTGGNITFSADIGNGQIVALRNNAAVPITVDTGHELIAIPMLYSAIFATSDNGKAHLLTMVHA